MTKRIILHAAKKLARGYRKKKNKNETLTAIQESHKSYEKIIQAQKADLENQLQLLRNENSQLTEKMEALESNIKEKNAIIKMLQYGTQGKCGVCSKNCKIIDSHPYSKVVLLGNNLWDKLFRNL